MSTCSILNRSTKEPKIFYKSDKGVIHNSLYDVLNDTSNSYEIGFMDASETFHGKATVPVFDNSTMEGKIQGHIRNGYLNGRQVAPNTYEATDNLAAEILETDLLLYDRNSFKKDGLNFTFGDFTPKFQHESSKQIIEAMEVYNEMRNNTKERPLRYTEAQLQGMIEAFMLKIGYSITSLEAYKKRHNNKFNIDPTAEALIDFHEKIIAVRNGEITLDALSEEFSHLIIEAWNQEEIQRMLLTVNNTQEYIEHAENYRNIYKAQISDSAKLEEAVRREVLGKMLAKSLQKDFSLEGRTATEVTFFQKLSDILRNFINFITARITPALQKDLDMMAQDIQNRLYNENLQERLNMDQSPILSVMYAVDEETAHVIRDLTKDIAGSYNSDMEKQVDGFFKDVISTATASLSELNRLDEDEVIPSDLSATIDTLLSVEDIFLQTLSRFKKADFKNQQMIQNVPIENVLKFRNSIIERGERTAELMRDLKGEYKNKQENHDIEAVVREVLNKYTNISEDQIDKIINNSIYGVKQLQRDTNGFIKLFGHTGKLTNIFVRMLHEVVKSLYHNHHNDFMDGMEKFARPLIEHRNKLKDFIKEGYIKSGSDYRKKEDKKRDYELSILKITHPGTYENMTKEEYLDKYQQFNIPELKTKDTAYYHYTYLYDKGLENQTWENPKTVKYRTEFIERIEKDMEPGVHIWNDPFFQKQVDNNRARSADKKVYMEQRRADASPFDHTGDLKRGFSTLFYSDAKKYQGTDEERFVVSTNPRATLFGGLNEPADNDIVFLYNPSSPSNDGRLAYKYMKWNADGLTGVNETDQEKLEKKQTIKENFEKSYYSFLKQLDKKNLTDRQRDKELRQWLSNSLTFDVTEEYWENFSPAGIDFEGFESNNRVSSNDKTEMKTLEKLYKEAALKKQMILRKYKSPNDYKEVDIQSISQTDRALIEIIENNMREFMYDRGENSNGDKIATISSLFEKYEMENLFKDGNESSMRMNLAFTEMFAEITGVDFTDASLKDYESFFLNGERFNMTRHSGNYSKLAHALKNKTNSNITEDYKERARKLGLDPSINDEVLKAFFISNSPSWYKRYDANSEYDSFIRDFNDGKLDIEKLISDYIDSDADVITYNDEPLELMRITPSYKFLTPVVESIDALYDEYKATTDNKEKFSILQRMAGLEEIHPDYQEDISDILNDSADLEVYMKMMDWRLHILETESMLKPDYVFMVPQQRSTDYERWESFFDKDQNKKEWAKDYFDEAFKFRVDDNEEFYKTSGKIPHYGYYRLKPEEVTTDIFHAMVWGLNNATLYDNRQKHYADAVKLKHGLEGQEFRKNQKATDTNYHKILNEMMDFNFKGKTVSKKMEFDIPVGDGITVDISKTLFKLKQIGVFNALAFSPIVAATNFIGGITQNLLMHTTGRKLYKGANSRAVLTLGKMFPESFKDIGNFDPEAKINKIMYSFGIYNLSERYENAKYNKVLRLLPQLGFSMMAMTNFPLEAQSTLSKLMEYRLIDGQFTSWRTFLQNEKIKNPDKSNKEISDMFESKGTQSMYDFLDDEGVFNNDLLEQAGYKGDIRKDKVIVMGAIKEITELTTMEMAKYNEGEGGRNPLASFVLTLKKWMVLSTSVMFSNRRLGIDGEEEGLIYSPKYIFKIFKTAIKDKESFRDAYNSLDEVEQMNVKNAAMMGAIITTMFALAMMLKGAADDEDEENNYLLQLSTYLALRGLNEAGSSNIMLPEAYYEAIQNPIMIGSTLKNMTNVLKVGDIGEEVQSGKYEGMDKYAAGILKATWLKNPYSVSSADVIGQTRDSYLHFNTKESLYHIFDFIPEKATTDEK